VLLVIVMGVTFGELAASYFFGINRGWLPIGLPWWTEIIAVVIGMFAYTILLRAPFRESPYILIAGVVTYFAITIGNMFYGPDIAAGIAALVLGIYGNLYSRLRRKQASITIAPAILYLVPGSMGLKSVFSIMEKNVFSGIETAFQMGMMALFIVTGLLVANLILPSRKIL
ncbi:MAG: threonine/serine exporter family protein, partial [Candidatus Omnitrophota bacterium]